MGNRPKAASTQARLAEFARKDLEKLVDEYRRETKAADSPVDVLGALVLAAKGLPVGVLRELVDIYKEEAKQYIKPPAERD